MKEHSVRILEEDALTPSSPFRHYPELAALIDILSRQERHHVLLSGPSSRKIQHAIVHGIAQQLRSQPTPRILSDVEIIYFDTIRFQQNTEDDFFERFEKQHSENQHGIVVINYFESLFNKKWLKPLLLNNFWRVIVFVHKASYQKLLRQPSDILSDFIPFDWKERDEAELSLALKSFGTELENFHHVTMSDDIYSSAVSMANHYLSGTSCLEKSLELLDSASARASTVDRRGSEHNPAVSSTHLAQVVSHFTQIPLLNLQNNYFQASKFIEAMQRSVFGQNEAIQKIAALLQTACIKLRKKSGPLCSFLFAGSHSVGKTTLAYAMADYLFGRKEALLLANPLALPLLFEGIQKAPYSIVLLKNIEKLSPETFAIFKEIVLKGYAMDHFGNRVDFQHAIFIFTTEAGSDRLEALFSKEPSAHDSNQPDDLMQLVLNMPVEQTTFSEKVVSHDVNDEVKSILGDYFSSEWLSALSCIPFMRLDYLALEKLMNLKIKTLGKHLATRFGLDLLCSPEVAKFLASEAEHTKKSLNQLLDDLLYACVTRAMLAYAENKNTSNQLLLQLNDNGQVLRCDLVTSREVPLHR